jgi:hypothetical protein
MTLHLVISNPSKSAGYGACVEVRDQVYDLENKVMTNDFHTAHVHCLDPGQACEVYITETRHLRITEYKFPVLPPTTPAPEYDPTDHITDKVVTIDESAHGHE